PRVSHGCGRDVDGHGCNADATSAPPRRPSISVGGRTLGRFLARLVSINDGWAKPFGDFNERWTRALFSAIKPLRDLAQGRWLGHPLHAAITDIPIGLLLGSVALDLIGQPTAADITLVGTILFMVAAAVCGVADHRH